MEIIRGLENLTKAYHNAIITLGNFDGVHAGHRRILERVKAASQSAGGTSIVITFDPHPVKVVNPQKGLKILTPFDIKAELIGKTGMDVLLCIDFNKEFSSIAPDYFIEEILVKRLQAAHIIVGHNYRFGKGKKGSTEVLRRRAAKFGFKFNVVRNVTSCGNVVSSSSIRHLLTRGDVVEARKLLGRPYFIQSQVITGTGRGKTLLQTPTANLSLPDELVPKAGVYVVRAAVDGVLYDAVANIGNNPTFGGIHTAYEVHLFDYDKYLVGNTIRVYFLKRLRDEKTFPSAEDLKTQIQKDISTAKKILAETPV
ncbi:bifunctional riboflavin kinase/FAD synthetase [Candidatus Magnetominusculus xianensis]|uniref:Riboflavin biosynthesis protein n=1 Tax=Candidatus Magnetominusculus xianensis TaxID=1748249 RepID=A0ABR5SBL4_9BACT|nr:bifunctional riboflavin kinase/FAD synthetase [Candidatus Magnetominusculus xianensis]KWT78172.1 riboflavin biosynthesis protein RibF [Candidatus Magnetominusculus xianensis]MBF0404691.1 bifunctional riboflavin kinase/FAD synthetase [Nitrospirota bacterium]